ncbi:MAG: hypothetical protein ACRC7V_09085 [Lachnospiraceae bacterium]
MQIKADIAGIEVQDFKENQVSEETLRFKGKQEVYLKVDKIDVFYKDGYLKMDDCYEKVELTVNEFLLMRDPINPKMSALGYFEGHRILPLLYEKEKPFDVSPRNASQRFAQEALMTSCDDVPLVILKGPAGTAKTFYSLAVGMEQVVNKIIKKY